MLVEINGERGQGKSRTAAMIYNGAVSMGLEPLILVPYPKAAIHYRSNFGIGVVKTSSLQTVYDLYDGHVKGLRFDVVIVDEFDRCLTELDDWDADRLIGEIQFLRRSDSSQIVLIN